MKILVHSHKFEISEPYSPGHQLTQAEAKALNALRARRIARQANYKLHQGVLTSPRQLELAQGVVADLDKNFSFEGQRDRYGIQKRTAFEIKLYEVAKEKADIQGGGRVEIEYLMKQSDIQNEALKRVNLSQEISEDQMVELFGSFR